MRRLLCEPLLHFMVLGVLVFAGFKITSRNEASQPGKIVVTQNRIESLVTGFTRTWQRPPTAAELDGLIREYVREEACTREAMALGLDNDDAVIRRRLRQKLEFISEGVAAQVNPTTEQLQEYLDSHADTFRSETRVTFRHVYLDPRRHGENLPRDIAQMLAQLQRAGRKADASLLGDSFLLDQNFDGLPISEVSKQFGNKFAAKLSELPVGQWQGPIESGYGLHLILVTNREEGRMPALEEVSDRVRREWANTERLEIDKQFYQNLLKSYTVKIEDPHLASAGETR